ncbi:probable cytochrome P450 6a14 [Musca domestica]|uniref:Cytochrome P450 n=1 Tax=Musca domestica TaxID=7370 RepID=Q27691_MUSDO|nr:probable cytochrome P450 6a14 [Musca domestica]AAA69816.1 cytochrome P450 [Musca domestica]
MMCCPLVVLLLGSLTLFVVYLYRLYTYWQRRGILQETPLPLLGNFKGLGTSHHLRDIYQRLYGEFKGKAQMVGSYMFMQRSALLLDLDLIKNVLIKDFAYFQNRGGFHNVEDDPLTGHLSNLEGEQWRALRAKLTPVFTSARMKYMFPTVVRVGEILSDTIRGEISRESPKDQVLEIKDFCSRYTTDVIANCAFGIECSSLTDPRAEFRQRGIDIFTKPRHHPLLLLLIITNPKVAQRLRLKLFPDELTEFFMSVIRQTVEYRERNQVKCNDFMDLLMEIRAKEGEEGLSFEQMAALTFDFFLAGFETSSTTMAFTLYELARNPEIQEKLRTEILDILKDSNDELSYEALQKMSFLEQSISETLRLYPVLATLVRVANRDYPVPDSQHIIEKDIQVVIPVHAIHHDPEYYENPEEFNPNRFAAEECERRHSSTYLPFGDGPRSCIGMRFGKMQTKIGLVSLLRHYRFECCPLTEIPLELDKKSFFVGSKNGIFVRVVDLKCEK